MVTVEIILVAFVTGIIAKSAWIALAVFVVLYGTYKHTRLSAIVGAALILYWTAVGFQIGRMAGGPVGALIGATIAGLLSAHVHRDAFSRRGARRGASTLAGPPASETSSIPEPRPRRDGEIIDAEYRVVS